MVELRKRKAPAQPPIPEKKGKNEQGRPTTKKQTKKAADTTTVAPSNEVPNVGDAVSLSGFGGEVETNEGAKTTLEELVNESESGVVLFTYPKASTPGCKFSISNGLNPIYLFIWKLGNLSTWDYALSYVYLPVWFLVI